MFYLKQNMYIHIKPFLKLKQLLLPLLHTLKHLTKHSICQTTLLPWLPAPGHTERAQNQSCASFFFFERYLQECRGGEEEPCWPLPFPKHGPCNTAATHRQEGNSGGIWIPPGSLFACVCVSVCHLWQCVLALQCVYCTTVRVCVYICL